MKKRKSYFITIILIVAVVALMIWSRRLFAAETVKEFMGLLSDCFLVPGVLFFGFGALSWASTKGVYDVLSFGGGSIMRFFIPGMQREKYDNFYNYKMEKEKKGRTWFPEALICGAVTLLLSFLVYAVYAAL